MTSADQRGWGDCGVPDREREQAYARAHITTVTVAGVRWPVRREVAPIFRALLERHIVPTIGPVTKVVDDWAYAPRCVRGTGPGTGRPCVISNHAWGLAIDVNATENAMGGDRHGQFPADFGRRLSALMIRWGGDYTSRADPMHFEFVGTPADARRITAALAAEEDDDVDEATLRRVVREVTRDEVAAALRALAEGGNTYYADVDAPNGAQGLPRQGMGRAAGILGRLEDAGDG